MFSRSNNFRNLNDSAKTRWKRNKHNNKRDDKSCPKPLSSIPQSGLGQPWLHSEASRRPVPIGGRSRGRGSTRRCVFDLRCAGKYPYYPQSVPNLVENSHGLGNTCSLRHHPKCQDRVTTDNRLCFAFCRRRTHLTPVDGRQPR